MKTNTEPALKIGDAVSWVSQSAGFEKTKTGIIVYTVPPNTVPRLLMPKLPSYQKGRSGVSYVVEVKGKRGAIRRYWPLSKYLKKSSGTVIFRNTTLGPKQVNSENDLTSITITTRVPEKWVAIDAETEEIWLYSKEKTWKKPSGKELSQLRKLFGKFIRSGL